MKMKVLIALSLVVLFAMLATGCSNKKLIQQKDAQIADLQGELDQLEGGGPLYHQAMQQLGSDGWLGIGWPKEHGGQGRGPIEQFIFFDEVQRAGFPIPILTLNTVGPCLMAKGSEEGWQECLPHLPVSAALPDIDQVSEFGCREQCVEPCGPGIDVAIGAEWLDLLGLLD